MKTMKQQLLAMLRHRLLPERSRRATGWHVLMLMLALLIGGSPQARASWPFDRTGTDAGGGNYRCHGNSDYLYPSAYPEYAYFETKDKFNIDNDQFYWGFHVRVIYPYFNKSTLSIILGDHLYSYQNVDSPKNNLYEGEIYLVTSDGTKHLVEKWKKDYGEDSYTPLETVDHTWGRVWVSNIEDNNVRVYYAPSTKAFEDGVKRIVMKQTVTCKGDEKWNSSRTYNTGWIEYEKDITLSGLETEKPMPKLSADWGDDGTLTFKAAGVPDKRSNDSYDAQGYNMNLYYRYDNGNKSSKNNTFTTADGSAISYTNETNGKMDMAYSYWPLTPSADKAKGAYTVPVFVEYRGIVKPNDSHVSIPSGHTLSQPWADGFFVKPFTRPASVDVDFEKWQRKTLVKWTRQNEATGYNGNKEQNVACRYDGKWHVIRYVKGQDVGTYKEIGTVDGSETKLELTDTDPEYDRDYIYRVVFLPTILENKYADKLHQLPGYGNDKPTAYDLWNEASINTNLRLHITLEQDFADETAVSLKWHYSIPVSGLTWYVEYRPTNEKTWREWTETIAVDPEQTEASAKFGGTVCDPVTYRIKTKLGGMDIYSDTLSATLPTGSYIKNVTATTGTEEKSVWIRWEVGNPDLTTPIKYVVKRRPIGTDEWTTIYENDTEVKAKWEVEDQRPLAGTYYEYTVEAYGTKCAGQVSRSDFAVVPGFSQARGTITGHIAYGSGTAVQGVRVNLVKSSAEQEGDQVQYLSRYIEGTGKGLLWQADSVKYAKQFNGHQPATMQLWAKPASNGSDQMTLATLNGALQLGVKRVGSEAEYKVSDKYIDYIDGTYTVDEGTGGTGAEGYDKLVDGNIKTKWYSAKKDAGVQYMCTFHTEKPVMVTAYELTTGNDNSTHPGRNPKDWILAAKLNKDDPWDALAFVWDDKILEDINSKSYTYATDKQGVYQYFSFVVFDNKSDEHEEMQLGELRLKTATDTLFIPSVTQGTRPEGVSDQDYCLYAVDLSSGDPAQYRVTEFPGLTFSGQDFTHVSAVYDGEKQWTFYVGSDSLRTGSLTVNNSNWQALPAAGTNTLAIGGSHQALTSTYKGYVDDVRLWSRALKTAEVESNYTRILGGTEEKLQLYWPLDEGENVVKYAFDIACQDGIYLRNHPEVGPNAVPRKEVPQRLNLYGMTDSEGDYIIKGIPFQQGGTNYKVTPMMGVHEFSPGTRSMFVSPTSLTANNIDFEDVSSFPMMGKVHYVDTNIPVEGAVLYVDGQPQSKDGNLVRTNDEGYYEVSVPIGEHYVEVQLDNHKMVAGGRFPLTGRYNFADAVTYNFQDSTLVNFVGRVAGGERSDTLGVGFGHNERIVGGPSKNNIGVATITLRVNSEKLSFNCKTGTTETHQQNRTWASDTVSVNSHTHTGFRNGEDHYIFIHTDSVTGEFSALLPPLKYTVKSIKVESNDAIEFTELPEIDLTSIKEMRSDSVRMVKENSADTVWVKYSYTTKMVKTYFAPPQLDVVDANADPGFFGLKKISFPSEDGETTIEIDDLYQKGRDPLYKVGYPIYRTGQANVYNLYAYEVYENRDVKDKVAHDTIPLPHVNVTVANEMSSIQKIIYKVMDESTGYKPGQAYELTTQQVPLDDEGKAKLTWTAGLPNITEPFTRKFSIALERKERTYNVADFDAIVIGQLTNGNNFVTKGPDVVNFVLRDPQGAKSTTKLTKGETHTKTFYDTRKAYGEYSLDFNVLFGLANDIGTGVGVVLLHEIDNFATMDAGVKTSWEKTWNEDSLYVKTTTENIATSDSKPYVGAPGDVYIGKSLNYLIGGCRRLLIAYNEEKKKYEVKMVESIAFGDTISTAFKFTQYELETVMIPKWKDMRREFLTEVASEAAARSYVNNGSKTVYLTWKGLNADNYEEGKDYIWATPKSWETSGVPGGFQRDSVAWCNTQISLWEQAISDNEADKVRLMNAGQKKENISIDGGSSYSYSIRESGTKHHETIIDWKMGFIANQSITFHGKNIVHVGCETSIKTEDGGGFVRGDGTIDEDFTEWEYNIEDGNRDTDLSLTIYHSDSKKYSDFFSVFGGQTYNPYQPQEVTHYYKPGTPLGNSTEQMEQPDMRIGLPGENPSTSVTVTDIPAGGEATVVLQCTNLGNAHQGVMFSYGLEVLDETNTNGLQILMDGVPINGRSLYLEHGESVTKVLTIRQTDQSILDYEGIKLWFESQYEPSNIHSEVTLNAHFVPSSSPVELAIDEPVVNSNTPGGELQMKLKGFNRQFKNLRNVGVQYRFQGSTQWTDLHTWWVNPNDTIGRDSLSHKLLPKTGDLRLALDMTSNLAYPEGNYEFRAFTTTPYGTEQVHVYSDVAAVIKDRKRPINLYTPAPANGILGYGDQMAIEFNEDIVPGYVGGDNVVVTAKLNSSEVHHDVAYQLVPFEEMMPRTVNPVFLTSSFAMDFWLNWHEAGTILHLGEKTDNFALSIGDDGYVTVTMGNNTYRSDAAVPKDKWTFFALNYDTEKKAFNMLALQDEKNIYLFSNRPVTMENVQAVHYLSDNCLYLGPVEADIHSLGLYNYCRDLSLASEDKYNAKDGYVYGLANFWPMDEGHGTVAGDLRHTHDFVVKDMWKLENKNYGLMINKPEGIMADITQVGTGDGESYAIEMWYNKSGNPKGETVFETATPDPYSPKTNLNEVTNLHLRFDSLQNLVLDYGGKSQVVASHEAFPDLRRYHHYALNVVRGQAASFYLDGQRTAVIPEADVPPMQGTSLVVGRNNEMLALVDEIRIWHAALSESRLLGNMYNTIDTADVYSRGLVAYYPFEKTGKENGVTTKVIALENMAPKATAMVLPADTASLIALTPPLKNAPDETVLTATPVASDRKVVINLSMVGLTARQLEGTTLNITVDKVRDLHGNESQPIRWTAYVQQNTLKWMKDSVNVIKKYGEDYTFDVDIENKSGSTEYYTLYNMPQWLLLVDSERSDDVSPLRTKTLRFRVNPLTPVGNYDATIGLQGNNGIQEPMRIVMKVRGERPQWAVDPTKYEHQMSIVGQVYINGILMENSESMVAAFIGDECRGVASPERVRGAAYVTMTVYGKDTPAADMGKTLSFRIWDASQGVAYTDAQIAVDGSPIDVTFSQDKMLGNFDKPVIWTKSENVEQLIPVHLNWNWIAFGVVPKSPYLDHIFADYADWQLLIKDRTLFSDYNGAEWNGTLQPVANAMYKLRIDRLPTTKKEAPNSLLAVSGRQLKEKSERAVTLSKGWNWIAYTPLTTMTVDEALAAANPQTGDIVKSQTAVAIYGPYGWEGSLKALEGGHGYLYFTNDSTGKSFLYPAASSASAKARMAAPRAAEEDELRIFHPVELGLYPSNMTMVIRLLAADGSPVDTCEVGAFIGDECRGAARASSRGLYYLVISGEGAGQPMTLRSCIDGKIIDIDNSLMYVSEDNIGTSWEPYVIDLSEIRTGISAIAADDDENDSDWYTLQGFKIGRKPTQPGVYIHHGKKVVIKLKK